jgi:penicillin-binding protein 1A
VQLLGRTLWRLAKLGLIVVVGVATLLGTLLGMKPVAKSVSAGASSVASPIILPPLGGISYLYDRYGNLQQSFNRQIRSPVDLDKVPTPVIGAVLAVEDSNFYRHGPVDARSILRALQTNVSAGGVEQGGSTITQQVVKKAVTGDKRDLERKLTEARYATTLEHQLTKDDILQYYLNMIYLGNNIYGVQAAAQTYWGKDISQLGWAEGALIAALIRNPNGYEPIHHPEAARKQRAIALKRAVETGRLSQAGADFANHAPLPTKLTRTVPLPDYFVEEVRRRLLNANGSYTGTPVGEALGKTPAERERALYGGGLRIYTTYDPLLQQKAIKARQSTVPGIRDDGRIVRTGPDGKERYATETITSVDPSTGGVRVLLGGPRFTRDSQNIISTGMATNPGSTFKGVVLAALFDRGFVPDDVIDGTSPCTVRPDDPNYVDPTRPTAGVGPQTAHNYAGEGGSVGTIRTQTLESSNCGFVRLGQVVGMRNVIDMAKALGFRNPVWNSPDTTGQPPHAMNPYFSQEAFGGGFEVSALDMAGAYATFANDGVHNETYLVDRIEDSSGHVIWSHKLSPKRVMSSQAARLITQVLTENVQSGTGTGARLASGQPAAGKTGTSDGPNDLWFAGYTPQLATAVWIGSTSDPFVVFPGGTGGAYAAVSWRAFMSSALEDQPRADFAPADPTRSGITLHLGPQDGMTFADRYGVPRSTTTRPAPDTTVAGRRSPTTVTPPPMPTSPEPPVTAYRP